MRLSQENEVGMFVDRVIVSDQVKIEVWRGLGINRPQEFDELLVSVPIQAAADDGSGGRVLARSKPSTPTSLNRPCQRQTVGFVRCGQNTSVVNETLRS